MKISFTKTIFIFFFSLIPTVVFAQNIGEQAADMYRRGDYKGVISLLKNTEGAAELYYLGSAEEKIGETGKAKDAFKKSFAESYESFFKNFDEWQKIKPEETAKPLAELLRENKEIAAVGVAAAEKAYRLESKIFEYNEWRIKARVLHEVSNLADSNAPIYSHKDQSILNAVILERQMIPPPKYNDGAPIGRRNQSPNKPTVVNIFIVCGTDGKLKLLMPTDKIIDLYTAHVLDGVARFKFQTATQNGNPVNWFTRMQFSYSIL